MDVGAGGRTDSTGYSIQDVVPGSALLKLKFVPYVRRNVSKNPDQLGVVFKA